MQEAHFGDKVQWRSTAVKCHRIPSDATALGCILYHVVYLGLGTCGVCRRRGMNVSISSICADSSMRMLSYLKPRLTSSPRFSAACVHVIAMICATTASVGIPVLRKKQRIRNGSYLSSSFRIRSQTVHFNSAADPQHVGADPDPFCHLDAVPDPTFHFHADPDPSFQIRAQRKRAQIGSYSIHFGLSSPN